MSSSLSGHAQTVLGPVSPDTLGSTTTHEHLLINFSCMFVEPKEASQKALAYQPVALDNLGWVRYNWTSSLDNLNLIDEDVAIREAMRYKMAGGGTIVDATTIGIGRDPLGLARIARATGLNVIMGAGFYVDMVHPSDMPERTESQLASQIVGDIREGVDDTGVKAGIIGELGCSWPLTDNERKVLRAAAIAQRETGAAILIHPGRDEQAPREIIEVLSEAKADISRTIMGHLDRTVFSYNVLSQLAQSGCYLEYDLFGLESSYYPLADIDLPSDAQRIGFIRRLIADGHRDRIVIAHDICFKARLVQYGGHGFAHILENIAPRMRRKGVKDDDIQAILIENPKRVLTFA